MLSSILILLKDRTADHPNFEDDEASNNTVSVRARNGNQRAGVKLDEFLNELLEEIDAKVATPSLVPDQSD